MRERRLSFKEALNSGIRAGLSHRAPRNRRFEQRTFALGAARNFQWEKAFATAHAIEDKELTRKLSLCQ
jgi:hypothetical protein